MFGVTNAPENRLVNSRISMAPGEMLVLLLFFISVTYSVCGKLAQPPGCHIFITANRSWSRYIPMTTAEMFDLCVNADCDLSHSIQKPDVSGCKWVFFQWERGLT